jgi:hypothetical protein
MAKLVVHGVHHGADPDGLATSTTSPRFMYSPHAHARIRSIKTSAARGDEPAISPCVRRLTGDPVPHCGPPDLDPAPRKFSCAADSRVIASPQGRWQLSPHAVGDNNRGGPRQGPLVFLFALQRRRSSEIPPNRRSRSLLYRGHHRLPGISARSHVAFYRESLMPHASPVLM